MSLIAIQSESRLATDTAEIILWPTNQVIESKQLAALNAIASSMNQSLDFRHTLNRAVEQVPQLLGFEAGFVFLIDKPSGELTLSAYKGASQQLVNAIGRLQPEEGLVGDVVCTGEPLIGQISRYDETLSRSLRSEGFRFFVAIPLRARGSALGVMVLVSHGPRLVNQDSGQFLISVGDVVGVAIENATLYRNVAELLQETTLQAERLRKSESQLRTVIESATDAVAILQNGRCQYINPYGLKLLGYSAQEARGLRFLDVVHPNYRQLESENQSRRLRGEIVSPYDIALLRKDGTEVLASLNTCLIEYEQQPAVLIIARDITERKQLEAQLLQAQKMESIGRLAGGVAHDFNNLLTAMMNYAEVAIRSMSEDDRARNCIHGIQKASKRGANLTRQLLAFARRQIIEPSVINLNDLILDIEKLLHRLISEDINLVARPEPELWSVKADPGQIEQVLINLAVNARDAMPGGGKLTIETANVTLDEDYARQHPDVSPGPYVMLTVSDTGVGMTDEVKAHIFEPFFTTKGQGKGTGLGLATCYGIIQQSRGHIEVNSELGQGTSFRIYLPRVQEIAAGLSQHEDALHSLPGTERILLVEDDEWVREVAVFVLREQGYHVLEAGNGTEALRLIRQHGGGGIHLLLTDVVMPEMGGKELADRLTAMHPTIKVLFMTGYTDDAIVHHGVLDAGITLLQKPFSSDALLAKVREVLDANPNCHLNG